MVQHVNGIQERNQIFLLTFLHIQSSNLAFSDVTFHFSVLIFNFDTSGQRFQRITRGSMLTLSFNFLMSRSEKR